jgi:hypothetical protein
MRAHKIDSAGLILNTEEVESLEGRTDLVDASIGGTIGDTIVGLTVIPAAPAQISAEQHNAPILAALDELDRKTIRPLRDGDSARVAAIEQQCVALRAQLRKG